MKKLFVLGIAIMAFGANSFASGKGAIIESLDTKTTQEALVKYLDADFYQESDLQYIFGRSQKIYKDALAKGESEEDAFSKAMGHGLLKMKNVLSRDQYEKFRKVLSQTIKNNEFNSYYVNN